MTMHSFKAAILPALLLAVASSYAMPAAAADVSFCGDFTGTCVTIDVKNGAPVVVTRVVVKQEDCGGGEKSHTKNLADGSSFSLKVDNLCDYKVSFKTTKGCTGTKDTRITSDDINGNDQRGGLKAVSLRKPCGSLQVWKAFARPTR